MLLVLDTNAYSNIGRFPKSALAKLLTHSPEVALPSVVVGELIGGFHGGNRLEANLQGLDSFLAQPSCSFLPISHATAAIYGRMYDQLKRAGRTVPTNDIWIAALTIEYDGQLATYDSDFCQIEGLRLAL